MNIALGASQRNNNAKMFSKDGSCGTSWIQNKHKTTYGQRYLAFQEIAQWKRQKTSRSG
jgi:hypothetical protein